MNSKLFGGILLVVGTTIGAGMLALPVATAQLGFWGSLVLLIGCWAVMTACAFIFLEVNLWLPPNSNLISMAGATLGKTGQSIAWVFYLLLLYSVSCAYIAGGGDIFQYVLANAGLSLSHGVASIIFTMLFGSVVYFGIKSVDYVNRGLMLGKLGALFILIILIMPFVTAKHLDSGHFHYITSGSSLAVAVLAFASLIIIPSLRTYFGDDVRSLRKAIFIGTLIPLFCYIAWDLVILGIVPLEGANGLKNMLHSASSNSDLLNAIVTIINKDSVAVLATFFTSICMVTSFLSVTLSLSDFLSDGFSIKKEGKGNLIIFGATYIPPIAIVLFYPNAFMRGIEYAGLSCFVLMVLLPPLMAWRGRYHIELAQEGYQVRGGKLLLTSLMMFGALMVGLALKGI